MAVDLPAKPIEHGSVRGYNQHRNRKVPACRPCLDAYNAEHREKRAAKKGGATPGQQRWNRGHVGKPTAPRPTPVGRDCPESACGALASTPQPSARMVFVSWPGSREPARWYCAGGCAAYGRALAEVRAIGDRRG